jgi:hypothetical protein
MCAFQRGLASSVGLKDLFPVNNNGKMQDGTIRNSRERLNVMTTNQMATHYEIPLIFPLS